MNSYNDFCKNILNIRNYNMLDKIKQIVGEEKKTLFNKTNDLAGYCKYIASLIENRLKDINIRTYWLDLNDLIEVDHVVLIAEYKYNNEVRRVLIDSTYQQFVKRENARLLKFKTWPSEKLDKRILEELLQNGLIELNDSIFNNYLSSFGKQIDINLDEFLLFYQTENIIKRK